MALMRGAAALAGKVSYAASMVRRLDVGGVPEHFNAPFKLAHMRGLYDKVGITFNWIEYPGGTGVMASELLADKIDLAIMLSEGAVARIAAGDPLRICGTFIATPLVWGVHVKAGSPLRSIDDLRGRTFGVSRMGSGSHLMAMVLGQQRGWDLSKDVPMKVVKSLDGAREHMESNEIEVFMWEKFTTKHLCQWGEWERIGEVPTPWPCFVFVASERSLATHANAIKQAIDITRDVCNEFKANAGDATLRYVAAHHKIDTEDANTWLSSVSWACNREVEPQLLDLAVDHLKKAGQVPEESTPDASLYLADGLCRLREQPELPAHIYSWRSTAMRNWIVQHRADHGGADPTMEHLVKAGERDQYHYMGIQTLDDALDVLRVGPGNRVLDVGCGIGGPARYLSWKSGCRVHGIDLQADLCAMGDEVTRIVGLSNSVTSACENAVDISANEEYDAFTSLLTILHVPEAPRVRLFRGLYSALKPDGRFLIEDYVCVSPYGRFQNDSWDKLRNVVGAAFVPSQARYLAALEHAGFVDIEMEDRSAAWVAWCRQRCSQFENNSTEQVRMHGAEVYEQRLHFYKTVAELFTSGELGGVRISGRKPSEGMNKLREGRLSLAWKRKEAPSSLQFGTIIEDISPR